MIFSLWFVLNLVSTPPKDISIIQDSRARANEAKAFVESGTDKIQGSPEDHPKAAYRTWESACQKWKAELLRLNGKNLMFSSCGAAKRVDESLQAQKTYSYQSEGRYKIRVQP